MMVSIDQGSTPCQTYDDASGTWADSAELWGALRRGACTFLHIQRNLLLQALCALQLLHVPAAPRPAICHLAALLCLQVARARRHPRPPCR